MYSEKRSSRAAIIPLGRDSRRDSSGLPEGCSPRDAIARVTTKEALFAFANHARRAGPALPSYLALHHAGFSVPRLSPSERWALTPPFHPYLRNQHFEGALQVSLRHATVLDFTGGIFSVALSVNRSSRRGSPDVIRRVAHRFPTLRPETSVSGLSSRLS